MSVCCAQNVHLDRLALRRTLARARALSTHEAQAGRPEAALMKRKLVCFLRCVALQ